MSFVMNLEHDGEKHFISIKQGGYVFKLEQPIFVTVEEGRIRGSVEHPVPTAIPKYNEECKGSYMPDGTAVTPKENGALVAVRNAPPCLPILQAAEAKAAAAAVASLAAGDAGVPPPAPNPAIPVVAPAPASAPAPAASVAVPLGVAPGAAPVAAP
jgi:hypothetical protein